MKFSFKRYKIFKDFEFYIDKSIFMIRNNNRKIISYSAHQAEKDSLPRWLNFNKDNLYFYGKPDARDFNQTYIN